MYTSLVLYSTIFALSMERTRLTFHCWLYTLYSHVCDKYNLNWIELTEFPPLYLPHPSYAWPYLIFVYNLFLFTE